MWFPSRLLSSPVSHLDTQVCIHNVTLICSWKQISIETRIHPQRLTNWYNVSNTHHAIIKQPSRAASHPSLSRHERQMCQGHVRGWQGQLLSWQEIGVWRRTAIADIGTNHICTTGECRADYCTLIYDHLDSRVRTDRTARPLAPRCLRSWCGKWKWIHDCMHGQDGGVNWPRGWHWAPSSAVGNVQAQHQERSTRNVGVWKSGSNW